MNARCRWILSAVLSVVLLPSLAACGESERPPEEVVPALGRQLDRVDAAVESGDYGRARTALERLVAEAAQAQVAGDLSGEQADRIFTAAEAVLRNLPDEGEDAREEP